MFISGNSINALVIERLTLLGVREQVVLFVDEVCEIDRSESRGLLRALLKRESLGCLLQFREKVVEFGTVFATSVLSFKLLDVTREEDLIPLVRCFSFESSCNKY